MLAPVAGGQTLTVVQGYDDPLPGENCAIGIGPDHCANQRYGLDLSPSNQGDTNILAPMPGTISWQAGDCMGIRTIDSLNLNICHFSSFALSNNSSVSRGTVLGQRSTSWIHVSFDNRNTSPWSPVPFSGNHSFEGKSMDPNGQRNQFDGWQFTSTNGNGQQEPTDIPTPSPGPGDMDGDGIPDDVDQCPDRAEDFDGHDDQDGCPEPTPNDPYSCESGESGAYLYKDEHYGGDCLRLTSDATDIEGLPGGFNDQVDSVRLVGISWVRLCEHANGGSICAELTYDAERMAPFSLENKISSVYTNPPRNAATSTPTEAPVEQPTPTMAREPLPTVMDPPGDPTATMTAPRKATPTPHAIATEAPPIPTADAAIKTPTPTLTLEPVPTVTRTPGSPTATVTAPHQATPTPRGNTTDPSNTATATPRASATPTPQPTSTATIIALATPTPIPLRGDVDCDGRTGSRDAVLVLQREALLVGRLACEDEADVNYDRRVDALDGALILQYTVGLLTPDWSGVEVRNMRLKARWLPAAGYTESRSSGGR